MSIEIMPIDEMTPEKVNEHMGDSTWSEVLEKLMDTCLEDSDTGSLKVAYALTSMFVQSSYMNMLFGQLQIDAVHLYELGVELRRELDKAGIVSQATNNWDETMVGLEESAKAMQVAINNVAGA